MRAAEAPAWNKTPAPDIAVLVESYLESSLARGHSRETVAYRRVYLQQLDRWLMGHSIHEAHQVTHRTLDDYVTHLATRRTEYKRPAATRLSVRTVATEVSVVRSLFAWLARAGILPANPADGLRVHKGELPPARAVLTVEEAERLMEAPACEGVGLRDRAILETLYSTGLRRAEMCGLDCYDVDAARGEVFVRQAKGGRERMVPIGRRALEAIRVYAGSYRRKLTADRREPALFLSTVSGPPSGGEGG